MDSDLGLSSIHVLIVSCQKMATNIPTTFYNTTSVFKVIKESFVVQNILCYFLQELESSKSDGEEKISAVVNLADQTLPQTAQQGQQTIHRELESLKHDWGRSSKIQGVCITGEILTEKKIEKSEYAKLFWASPDSWSFSPDIWLNSTSALRRTFPNFAGHVRRVRQISRTLEKLKDLQYIPIGDHVILHDLQANKCFINSTWWLSDDRKSFLIIGNYKTRLSESEEGLKGALQAWDDFDALFDNLNKWLKENEAKVKDHELKNSLDDKRQQLEKFKVRWDLV